MEDISTLNTIIATVGSVAVGLVTALIAVWRGKQTAQASMKETAYAYTLDLLKAERDERANLLISINALRDEMQEQDQYLRELRAELHAAQKEIAVLKNKIDEQDEIIRRQEEIIEALRTRT